MRALIPIVVGLAIFAALPCAAQAGDAEGCVDLKLLPRLEGCIIQECSAKQHESFETGVDTPAASTDSSAVPLDANVNSLTYSCPASMDPARVKRELDAEIRKAGYQNVAEDKTDAANPVATARKGSHWLRWGASSEDGSTSYSLISAESSTEKFKAEACAQPPVFSLQKSCEIVECTSKSEDSVGMRTAQKAQASIAGAVQTATLACPANSPAQMLSAAEEELKRSGFEILFNDHERPESGWITGRAGKKWVELVTAPDGESVSYALTVVPSAEVLTAAQPEPKPVAIAAPTPPPTPAPAVIEKPQPAPKPVEVAVMPAPQIPAPIPTPVAPTPPAALPTPPASADAGFVPPTPILEVPIEATHDRIYSVTGDILISFLVDVGEDGSVIKAVLTGRVTKDVIKLEDAALDAVFHWRFEPARQDGRVVPAVKIPVQIHFHGRPWQY
jgi:protein TonB